MSKPGDFLESLDAGAAGSILESPKIAGALEDFITEALDEATDLLLTGDIATKTSIIKMVLGMTLSVKKNSGEATATKMAEETRARISSVLD